MYREQYGLDIVITRFANVYGLRCHGVIHDFLEKLAKNPNKLEIIGTGQQSRDFVHVSDVVEALVTVGSLKILPTAKSTTWSWQNNNNN